MQWEHREGIFRSVQRADSRFAMNSLEFTPQPQTIQPETGPRQPGSGLAANADSTVILHQCMGRLTKSQYGNLMSSPNELAAQGLGECTDPSVNVRRVFVTKKADVHIRQAGAPPV